MRQQDYSHPQLSSGYACRDKRWSGLIPSNKIESYHLLSSVALGSAMGTSSPQGYLQPQLSIVWAQHLGGKSNISASGSKCVCTHEKDCVRWELGWAQHQVCQRRGALPTSQKTHSHPGLRPWLQTQSGNTGLDRSEDAATSRRQRRICYKTRIYDGHLPCQLDPQNSLIPV